MQRKLTISVDDEVYRGLHEKVGRGQISSFIEELVRPHVVEESALEAAYREAAADEEREREAMEWAELAPDEGLEAVETSEAGA
ncbi:MAG TPA: addiction module antitoxin [Chloroflexota bacterium]|nr:addiction module antitoxin [Chloroflexota bacterium]